MEVYFALNRTNGKAYVGWTSKTAQVRFGKHCRMARWGSPLYFHRAIHKYGPESFDVLTVWKGDDAEEMKQVECNYIAGMRLTDPRFGYNLTLGGDGGIPNEETRLRISEAACRRPMHGMTKQCLQARASTQLGVPVPQTQGDKHWTARETDEHRQARVSKAAESNRGKTAGHKHWTQTETEEHKRIRIERFRQTIKKEAA